MEAERDKDNHGRASEIFSRSMASGSYLFLDTAANRLKLPLSLCQDENGQLYLLAEETRQGFCELGSFSAPALPSRSGCCFWTKPNGCAADSPPQWRRSMPFASMCMSVLLTKIVKQLLMSCLDFEDIVPNDREKPESCQKCSYMLSVVLEGIYWL